MGGETASSTSLQASETSCCENLTSDLVFLLPLFKPYASVRIDQHPLWFSKKTFVLCANEQTYLQSSLCVRLRQQTRCLMETLNRNYILRYQRFHPSSIQRIGILELV
ncbi:hypothetical protein DPEC_G00111700 [Dallia pectoralis]|uniref:Uncharacterized protein n=1 Tax=Dallia pectoralis TaxID=75939 RepID=A0ACC2GTL8_DALPE|nr:hypothetical protein DPEC_G00111700 [Dallia pectoralis]